VNLRGQDGQFHGSGLGGSPRSRRVVVVGMGPEGSVTGLQACATAHFTLIQASYQKNQQTGPHERNTPFVHFVFYMEIKMRFLGESLPAQIRETHKLTQAIDLSGQQTKPSSETSHHQLSTGRLHAAKCRVTWKRYN